MVDAGGDSVDGAVADGTDAAPLFTFCDLETQSISPSGGQVAGVLAGATRYPSVSCSASTPEPEAFFSLELAAFTIVDLRVDAQVDTSVAVRSGCTGSAVELGCGSSAGIGTDGGVPDASPSTVDGGSTSRTSHLRVGLAAGRYTVVVDAAWPGTAGSVRFTLTATTVPLASNASCAAATRLDATTSTAHAELDLAGPPAATCNGASERALYYAYDVPAGHHLVVFATATAGDRDWLPRLVAFDTCGATTCLARDSATAGATQRLDWINNGASDHVVLLAVSADASVNGAEVDLSAGTTDLFTSCARAMPVHDGSTFTNLSLASVMPTARTCVANDVPALYFAATLAPYQELHFRATSAGGAHDTGATFGVRSACDDTCNAAGGPNLDTINQSSQPQTFLVELTRGSAPFDLQVSMPLAPGGILVAPTSPRVTSEAGGQATFAVTLASPPSAPATVSVPFATSRPSEGSASPATLVFDATSWKVPQTVTVTGVDDHVSDGAQVYTLHAGPATSDDPRYAGLAADDVSLTNLDDDPALLVGAADELVTSEDGVSVTFTVQLTTAPTADVHVALASSDTSEGSVSPAALTFTPASWNVPQTVTVTGVDDAKQDGARPYAITFGPLASADAAYAGLTPAPLALHNRDDDFTAGQYATDLGNDSCGSSGSPNQFPIAVDALGRLYVIIDCPDRSDGPFELFTSTDGGATLSAAKSIPGSASSSGELALAGGHGGTAFVVFAGLRGLTFARSTDLGASWSERALWYGDVFEPLIAVGGDTIVVVAENQTPTGVMGTVLLRSLDGGLSFEPEQLRERQTAAVAVSPDGRSVWLVDDLGTLVASGDSGATFADVGATGGPADGYSFTSRKVYALSPGYISVTDLADTTQASSGAAQWGQVFAGVADDRDVLTVFGVGAVASKGGVVGSRLDPDGNLTTSAVVVSKANVGGGTVLSRHATVFAGLVDQTLTISISNWP